MIIITDGSCDRHLAAKEASALAHLISKYYSALERITLKFPQRRRAVCARYTGSEMYELETIERSRGDG